MKKFRSLEPLLQVFIVVCLAILAGAALVSDVGSSIALSIRAGIYFLFTAVGLGILVSNIGVAVRGPMRWYPRTTNKWIMYSVLVAAAIIVIIICKNEA